MTNKKHIVSYSGIALLVFCIDRISKAYAAYRIPGCVINRGIVGGLCNSAESSIFIGVTLLVIALYCSLGIYTFFRYYAHQSITGEILVLAGGFSNIIDRFVFHGVLDFILLSFKGWSWPMFNVADAAIVVGVFIMMFTSIYDVKTL